MSSKGIAHPKTLNLILSRFSLFPVEIEEKLIVEGRLPHPMHLGLRAFGPELVAEGLYGASLFA